MEKKGITQDKVVYFINNILLLIFAVIVLYPLIYVVSCSFSSGDALMGGKVRLLPVDFTFEGYKTVFGYTSIWVGYKNTIIYTFIGVVISLVMTLLAAYPLSRDDFRGRKGFTLLFVFTMMFSGGMIPSYLLVKNLHLLNTMWAVILPGCVSAYNVVVARTFQAVDPQGASGGSRVGWLFGLQVFYQDRCTAVKSDYRSALPVVRDAVMERIFQCHDLHSG